MPWTKDPDAWVHLGAAIRRERERQGLLQEELADRAGVSVGTVRNAEAGRVPKGLRWPQSLTQIEKALGWGVGSMEAVLAGEEPALPSQQEIGATGHEREPKRPESPVFRFRKVSWFKEHGQEALTEVLPDVEKFAFLCTVLDAPPPLVEAYERAVQELLDGVREAQGWPEEPPM